MPAANTINNVETMLIEVSELGNFRERLATCAGVAFIKLYQIGFFVNVRGGNGVVFKRNPSNEWSAPAFVKFGGPALGCSLGVECSNFVVIFQNESDAEDFASGNFELGLGASAALGPFGLIAEIGVGTGHKDAITVFGNSKGLYGGVNIQFGFAMTDKTANRIYYDSDVRAHDVLCGPASDEHKAKRPELKRALESLEKYSVSKAAEQPRFC